MRSISDIIAFPTTETALMIYIVSFLYGLTCNHADCRCQCTVTMGARVRSANSSWLKMNVLL